MDFRLTEDQQMVRDTARQFADEVVLPGAAERDQTAAFPIEEIRADPLAWLARGTVDYVAPQLYWPFGGGQDYAALAAWWVLPARTSPAAKTPLKLVSKVRSVVTKP